MKYAHRTPHFGIPVPGRNQPISSSQEMRKWQIVENILRGCTRGIKNCVFEEGDMAVEKRKDAFAVVLRAVGVTSSLSGVAGGVFFEAPPCISWDDLKPGGQYHLYVCPLGETYVNPSKIRLISSTYPVGDRFSLHVASVDLRGDTPLLDKNPDGKVWAHNLSFPSSVFSHKVVDFVTAGRDGVVVSAGGRVLFVSASRVYDGRFDGEMGDVVIGYHGADARAQVENQAVVYNIGDKGLSARAIVFYG